MFLIINQGKAREKSEENAKFRCPVWQFAKKYKFNFPLLSMHVWLSYSGFNGAAFSSHLFLLVK